MAEHAESEGPSVGELLGSYERMLLVVTAARSGAPVAPGNVARCALGALTAASTIVDQLADERWPVVAAGLLAGVSLAELGVALGGFEPDEIASGLTFWVDRRHSAGELSVADRGRVLVALAAVRAPA